MAKVHYTKSMFMGDYPICGRAPSYSRRTMEREQVTCRFCIASLGNNSPKSPATSAKKTVAKIFCASCGKDHRNMKTCPMNDERAEAAMKALTSFARDGGEFYLQKGEEEMGADLTHQNMGDLLCNLAHLCDSKGIAFADVLRSAKGHYEEEVAGEEKEQPQNITQEFYAS